MSHQVRLLSSTTTSYKPPQSSATPLEDLNERPQPPQPGWTSFWLRKSFLRIFAGGLVILAVIIGSLSWFSKHNHGICSANADQHYLWTYAPTALFTLIAAFWDCVDYRAKQIFPWQTMARHGVPASDSILLDYITAFEPLALVRAFRKGHVMIGLVSTISIVFRISIVLSTGLFGLQPTRWSENDVKIPVVDRFMTTATSFDPASVDFRAATNVIGMHRFNLTPPDGTSLSYAYQRLVTPENLGSSVEAYEIPTDTFTTELQCSKASVELNKYQNQVTSVWTDHCRWKAQDPNNAPWIWRGGHWTNSVSCAEGAGPDQVSALLLMSTNDYALMCTPSYKIEQRLLRATRGQTPIIGGTVTNASHIMAGLDGPLLYNANRYAMASVMESIFDAENEDPFNSTSANVTDHLFGCLHGPLRYCSSDADGFTLLGQLHTGVTMDDLERPDILQASFSDVFRSVSAQVANLYLKEPSNDMARGSVTYFADRLLVKSLTFWLLEACLLLLAVLIIVVSTLLRDKVVPRDPSTLAGTTIILANSRGFRDNLSILSGDEAPSLSKRSLACDFYTTMASLSGGGPRFMLHAVSTSHEFAAAQHGDLDARCNSDHSGWYRPLPARIMYRIGLPLLLMSLIIVLEVLLRQATARQGLLEISDPTGYTRLGWTYIPAAVMVCTRSLVSSVYSAVKVLQLYHELYEMPRNAQQALFINYLNFLGPLYALKRRQVGFLTSALGSFIAAFLGIAVSGLYTTELVPTTVHSQLPQSGWFYDNTNTTTWDPSSIHQVGAVTLGNLSYPEFTYAELALATFETPTHVLNATLNASVPAVRGRMNCTAVPADQIKSIDAETLSSIGSSDQRTAQAVNIALSSDVDRCGLQLQSYLPVSTGPNIPPLRDDFPPNNTFPLVRGTWDGTEGRGRLVTYAPEDGYFGSLLRTGINVSLVDNPYPSSESTTTLNAAEPGPGCFHMIGVFGRVRSNSVEDVAVFTCAPFAEVVQVHAAFDYNTLQIDRAAPPVADEQSARNFGFRNIDGRWTGIKDKPETGVEDWNALTFLNSNGIVLPGTSDVYDGFFDALVNGPRGIPPEELSGLENTDRLLNASHSLYGLAFAQFISTMRKPLDTPAQLSVTATFLDTYRLQQSVVATRILQALLATILVLVLAAFMLVKMRRLVPEDPCSIAAVASLLLNSDLLDIIPSHAEDMSDKQLQQEVFAGHLLSLGWWGDLSNGQTRYGIDIGKAERSKPLRSDVTGNAK